MLNFSRSTEIIVSARGGGGGRGEGESSTEVNIYVTGIFHFTRGI